MDRKIFMDYFNIIVNIALLLHKSNGYCSLNICRLGAKEDNFLIYLFLHLTNMHQTPSRQIDKILCVCLFIFLSAVQKQLHCKNNCKEQILRPS